MTASLPRIRSVAPVIYGVIKILFTDGFEGVVDLRPVLATGDIYDFLRRNPERFADVAVSEYGHSIFWTGEGGYETDFGADGLRREAERQAELHRSMAS